MKPILRHLLRDEQTLQYGVHPLRAVMLSGLTRPVRQWIEGLDGTRDLDAVLRDAARAGLDATRARALLDQLAAQGALHDAAAGPGSLRELPLAERDRLKPDLDALDLASTAPDGMIAHFERRRRSRVRVYGAGRIGAQVVALLAAAGVGDIRVLDPGTTQPADLTPGGLTWAEVGLPREVGAVAAANRITSGGATPGAAVHGPDETTGRPRNPQTTNRTPSSPAVYPTLTTPTNRRNTTPTPGPDAAPGLNPGPRPGPGLRGVAPSTRGTTTMRATPTTRGVTNARGTFAAPRPTAQAPRGATSDTHGAARNPGGATSDTQGAAQSPRVDTSHTRETTLDTRGTRADSHSPTSGRESGTGPGGTGTERQGTDPRGTGTGTGRKDIDSPGTRRVGGSESSGTRTARKGEPARRDASDSGRTGTGTGPMGGSGRRESRSDVVQASKGGVHQPTSNHKPTSNVVAGGPFLGDKWDRPDLVVLAQVGPLDTVLVNELNTLRIPHLLVAAFEGYGCVGPLVLPGETACLHCLDLTRRDHDPHWPIVTARLGGYPPGEIACDVALATAVAAAATGHALAYLDGKESSVTNGTVDVTPDWQWKRRSWRVHPQCRCMRSNPYSLRMVMAPNRD
ncbi:ThiF family adenylyltransferase [Nonomuraea sp. NPDC048882]|uniref:ThiF family adenylyltransferase n=1 Tax=Nonomuraea sp. NPDC048882 TaxID=3154347 RepID=UPI0033DF49B3